MEKIETKLENCVNCHRCIAVCPVKYCLDASSGKTVSVNVQDCIFCGRCVDACSHDARVSAAKRNLKEAKGKVSA